ncbi:MAG TPA: LamG domain-containing protein [Micromonospora sp.]|nr:LamG domain-containing protein [Micromonospora sp.]
MTLAWPDRLPAPTVDAETATYAEVLPDVDLVVKATRTGFTHVLVVKTPQAAANPAVREIRLVTGGDAELMSLPNGELRAVADGRVLAFAPAPTMWDSSTPSPEAGAASVMGSPTEVDEPAQSSPEGPGDAAVTASVDVEVTASGDLKLRPAPALLDSDASVFPLFVDPSWSTGRNRWAYATSNNSTNDTTHARVGKSPDTGVLYRSYFEFPMSGVRGKYVHSAYVQMKLYHSWSCGDTYTHMFQTSSIASTPRTKWALSHNKWMSSAASHANKGTGCKDSPQPDMIVNFTGNSVTSVIRTGAKDLWANVTVGFCACNANGEYESNTDRWKKFYPANAKLVVDFSSYPGQPHSLQAAGVACATSGRTTIGTLTPTLSAIYPDADTAQSLSVSFEWLEIPSSGVYGDSTPRKPAPPGLSVPANNRGTSATLSGVQPGKAYAFRTRATDPDPYNLTSPWSPWCEFEPDTTVPPVTVTIVTPPAGPGQPGTFKIESPATDVTKFRYGWSAATTEVAATGTSPKSATVTLTVPKYGNNILYVSAIDATLNQGHGSVEFIVGRPSPPVAHWGLETYPGVTEVEAFVDRQPALGGDTPLTASHVSWVSDTRLLGGQAAGFNGTSSQLVSATAVVDTTDSFSVAAWVRLSILPTSSDIVVAAQEGSDGPGFHLGTRLKGSPLTPRWSFLMKDTPAQSSATRAAVTTAALTSADVGRWTHLAGVYDKPAGKVRLYVDGLLVAEADRTASPWPATGRFTVGRGFSFGGPTNWWHGAIADVQVFNRALVEHDFTGQLKSDSHSGGFDEPGILAPIEVGRWDFETGYPCYLQDLEDTCEAGDATGFNRWLALTRGSEIGAGQDGGSALWLDGYYFPEENPEPWEATEEYGRSALKAGVDSSGPDPLTVWQDTPVLRTDQSFTVSAWASIADLDDYQTVVAQDGSDMSPFRLGYDDSLDKWCLLMRHHDEPDASYTRACGPTPEVGQWTHLVGVFDAGTKAMHLYVNGQLAGTASFTSIPWQGNGPLTVGRTLYTTSGGAVVYDLFRGGIDDVHVFQGAMTDAQVQVLFDEQAVDPEF